VIGITVKTRQHHIYDFTQQSTTGFVSCQWGWNLAHGGRSQNHQQQQHYEC